MSSIPNNPVYIESVRYTAGVDGFQKNINQSAQNSRTYEKYFSQEAKNIIVSEKPEKSAVAANFYKYQYNSPASRMMYTGQTFNEIEKPYIADQSASQKNSASGNTASTVNYDNFDTALGYYIFDSRSSKKASKDKNSEPANPIKKKLEKTYHLNENSEPGSLVNITYY